MHMMVLKNVLHDFIWASMIGFDFVECLFDQTYFNCLKLIVTDRILEAFPVN